MRHQIVVKSGLWAGLDVYFQGAVFMTPGHTSLLARDITSAVILKDVAASQPDHYTVDVKAIGWSFVVELTARAYQSIAAHQTASLIYGRSSGSSLSLEQQLATYQEKDATTRSCCGGK